MPGQISTSLYRAIPKSDRRAEPSRASSSLAAPGRTEPDPNLSRLCAPRPPSLALIRPCHFRTGRAGPIPPNHTKPCLIATLQATHNSSRPPSQTPPKPDRCLPGLAAPNMPRHAPTAAPSLARPSQPPHAGPRRNRRTDPNHAPPTEPDSRRNMPIPPKISKPMPRNQFFETRAVTHAAAHGKADSALISPLRPLRGPWRLHPPSSC
jgi:hypothetical protein